MFAVKRQFLFVLIQVVPLLVVFFSKLFSFYRKERKVPQSLFLLFGQCFQSAGNKRNCKDLQIVPE
ncbi:hypothetical protein C7N43_23740 [Sphingobacteriales bacterium UPWRP_1]|nr:hypothetical protein C7N43_23740 [Sphingobacteriales bacterium UPWRP_1]